MDIAATAVTQSAMHVTNKNSTRGGIMQKTHSSGDSGNNPFTLSVNPRRPHRQRDLDLWSFNGETVAPPLDHGTVTCGSRSHDLEQEKAALHPLSQPGVMSDFVTVQPDIHYYRASGTS